MILWNNYNQPSRCIVFEALLTYITLSDADSVVMNDVSSFLWTIGERGKLSVVILFKDSIIINKAYNWPLRLVRNYGVDSFCISIIQKAFSIILYQYYAQSDYESSIGLGIES
jgi:hypothetical protein